MGDGFFTGMVVAVSIAAILVATGVVSIKLMHEKKHTSSIDDYSFDRPLPPYQPPTVIPVPGTLPKPARHIK